MKWELSIVAFLATLAIAAPQNKAANDGSGGVAAAAKAEAAVLLTENGDEGAVDSGKAFDDAVQKISDSGNKQDLQTLTDAGIDVNTVLGQAGGNGGNNANAKGQAAKGQAAKGQAAKGQAAQGAAAKGAAAKGAAAKGQ